MGRPEFIPLAAGLLVLVLALPWINGFWEDLSAPPGPMTGLISVTSRAHG
ncbi:hypothetical protein [Streptomyces roseicoloratus]|uniref:Uncharacterized protein n=1 Tax=Streptomyces roseicoloratus TaxID=2508722 RepID=A0ABY9S1L4_9ACTN|nr:hypothetical protein [Streptomyces roseicoloratus]WMX48322.1 hypothetical protein RGF97_30905 [Streptomyces roseicoloratus]